MFTDGVQIESLSAWVWATVVVWLVTAYEDAAMSFDGWGGRYG